MLIVNVRRIGLIIASLAIIALSCSQDLETIFKIIDTELEPDLTVENIETLHFDSARLQVRMASPLMKQFTSAMQQRREFPEGVHVWLYESTGELGTEITANWAMHNIDLNLWEARGNVVVTTEDGRKIETEQLFWDQEKALVYSHVFTEVTQANGTTASGDSFEADQDFESWRLFNRSGVGRTVIFIDDDENETDKDEFEHEVGEDEADE